MTRLLVLDTGPAGKIAHPKIEPEVVQWLADRQVAGDTLVLPEIVDYELRRNFLLEIRRGRASFAKSLERLDDLRDAMLYLPLSSDVMKQAAEFWAEARSMGKPTADEKALDGDVILMAQARAVGGVIVTENPKHLGLFASVESWP